MGHYMTVMVEYSAWGIYSVVELRTPAYRPVYSSLGRLKRVHFRQARCFFTIFRLWAARIWPFLVFDMENPHDGEQSFFYVLDMNTPDIHFNLQNTTLYYICLSQFVRKVLCLFCTLEYMHWITIINNSKQLLKLFGMITKASSNYYRIIRSVEKHWLGVGVAALTYFYRL